MIKNEKGFTLIELLVVVAIIAILAAIAVPQFTSYQVKAKDASAQADLRNLAVAVEQCYITTSDYTSCDTAAELAAYGYNMATGVTTVVTAVAGSWTATATATGGTAAGFSWNSAAGGAQW